MKKPRNITRRNWSFLIPQISVILLITFVFRWLRVDNSFLLGLSIYLLLAGYLKITIPRWHRKALYYLRKGEMEGAAFAFEKSYQYFKKHEWLDKYRAFLLLSMSGYSYCEMATMNSIYCYQQLGNKSKMNELHKRLSKEFPYNPYSNPSR
ncbi:MAG: hypothetical protein IPM71_01550 [Bacteroidota bacterium]|nr:MAG: hypothetical protein IPM71_01550 [Bacteroidota bacterium]